MIVSADLCGPVQGPLDQDMGQFWEDPSFRISATAGGNEMADRDKTIRPGAFGDIKNMSA